MRPRSSGIHPLLTRLVLLALAGVVLAIRARRRRSTDWLTETVPADTGARAPERAGGTAPVLGAAAPELRPGTPARLAAGVIFAALFLAGAALSAFAGNEVGNALQSDTEGAQAALPATPPGPGRTAPGDEESAAPEAADTPTTETQPSETPLEAAPPPDQPVESPGAAAVPEETQPLDAASASAETSDPVDRPATRLHLAANAAPAAKKAAGASAHRRVHRAHRHMPTRQLLLRRTAPAPDPEAQTPGTSATVWINRPLPDPTPPAARLSPSFARRLVAAAHNAGVDWTLVLGLLRADGSVGSVPAARGGLLGLSARIGETGANGAWATALALSGSTVIADRAQALSRYYRAAGLKALVRGLEATKADLAARLLRDPRVHIYPGGRGDIEAGRVDVRVLAVIAYLAESFGEVTVSCLISGHRLYARPGVVSAHIFGRAVDIGSLGGIPIAGNQLPGGVTEHAIRDILLLPNELQPRQVISLLGLGGPSFPLADHVDHIHVGY